MVNDRKPLSEVIKLVEENIAYFNHQSAEVLLESCTLILDVVSIDTEPYKRVRELTEPFIKEFGLRTSMRHAILEAMIEGRLSTPATE